MVDYGYDNLNRLTTIAHGPTQTNIVFTYDELNRPKTMTDQAGSSAWTYTRNGLPDTVTRDGKTIDYDYDQLDRLSSVKDPEGIATTYTYTGRNLLESATQDGKTVTYAHDPNANLSAIQYPNGVACEISYDDRNQITQMLYKKDSAPLLTLSYTYDQAGLRKSAKRLVAGRDDRRTYVYDKRLQLTNSTRTLKSGGTVHSSRLYGYDDNYNRQTTTVDNTTTITHSTDISDRLNSAGTATFGYNTNNNCDRITESGSTVTLSYNHADQVTEMASLSGTATYVYDGNGQRIKRTPPGGTEIRYLWAGDEVLKEYHSDGNVQYLLGSGREGIKKDGSWKFYLTDAQGSVVALTDEQGNVTDTWDYDDFGETTRLTGSSYNPYLYTGQQFDPEFGGHYFLRARLYYPQYGRFLSRDPIGWSGGSNVYAYCDNNSLNSSDPSGLLPPDGPANDRYLQSQMRSSIPEPRSRRTVIHRSDTIDDQGPFGLIALMTLRPSWAEAEIIFTEVAEVGLTRMMGAGALVASSGSIKGSVAENSVAELLVERGFAVETRWGLAGADVVLEGAIGWEVKHPSGVKQGLRLVEKGLGQPNSPGRFLLDYRGQQFGARQVQEFFARASGKNMVGGAQGQARSIWIITDDVDYIFMP